jgi:hypothetical protein
MLFKKLFVCTALFTHVNSVLTGQLGSTDPEAHKKALEDYLARALDPPMGESAQSRCSTFVDGACTDQGADSVTRGRIQVPKLLMPSDFRFQRLDAGADDDDDDITSEEEDDDDEDYDDDDDLSSSGSRILIGVFELELTRDGRVSSMLRVNPPQRPRSDSIGSGTNSQSLWDEDDEDLDLGSNGELEPTTPTTSNDDDDDEGEETEVVAGKRSDV